MPFHSSEDYSGGFPEQGGYSPKSEIKATEQVGPEFKAPFPLSSDTLDSAAIATFANDVEGIFTDRKYGVIRYENFTVADQSTHTEGTYTFYNYLGREQVKKPAGAKVSIAAQTGEAMMLELVEQPTDGAERKIAIWYLSDKSKTDEREIRVIFRKVNGKWSPEGAYIEHYQYPPKEAATPERVQRAFERATDFLATIQANKEKLNVSGSGVYIRRETSKEKATVNISSATPSTGDLPTGEQAVRGVEDFLKKQRDNGGK